MATPPPPTYEAYDPRGWSKTTQILAVCGGITGAALAVALPFITPALRKYCIPYVPATEGQVRLVLEEMATHVRRKTHGVEGGKGGKKPLEGVVMADLGCGDGRVVIEAAKQGAAMATGIEINWWLVMYGRIRAWREGVGSNTRFIHGDLWKARLDEYHAMSVFGVAEMLPKLETKMEDEMQEGAVVVACRFPLPNWIPVHKIERSHLLSVWTYDHSSINSESGKEGTYF